MWRLTDLGDLGTTISDRSTVDLSWLAIASLSRQIDLTIIIILNVTFSSVHSYRTMSISLINDIISVDTLVVRDGMGIDQPGNRALFIHYFHYNRNFFYDFYYWMTKNFLQVTVDLCNVTCRFLLNLWLPLIWPSNCH